MRRSLIAIVAVLICAACSKNKSTETIIVNPLTGEEQPTQTPKAICLWKEIAVREIASEKGKYLTSIYLGEEMEALSDTASEQSTSKRVRFHKVKLKDGMEGWVRDEFIAIQSTAATVLSETPIYKRPDIMSAAGKNFQPMDFVAIKKKEGDWLEVVGKRVGDTWFTTGWIKSKNLTTEEVDVAFSIFYSKAMDISDETKRNKAINDLVNNADLSSSVFVSKFQTEDEYENLDVEIDSTAAK